MRRRHPLHQEPPARVVQTDIKHLNVYDVLNADKVVVEENALQYINDFYGESGAA